MTTKALQSAVHHGLIKSLLATGAACNADELARELSVSAMDVEATYRWLHENHGLVLHPDFCEPWVVHPFSLSPTHTWVECEERGWWAPCMWCALGIVHLAGGTGCVHTRLGGEREPVAIDVAGGVVTPAELVVHFALPVRSAWHNVHHFCAMVLPFRSHADIAEWSTRHRVPEGEAVPIDTVSALAREWYGQHDARDWTKWTAEQASDIFARVGLTGPFWDLRKMAGTF